MFIAGAGKCGGTPLGVRCAVRQNLYMSLLMERKMLRGASAINMPLLRSEGLRAQGGGGVCVS